MPAGFHVASAYVDIHAEDAGLRNEIKSAIQSAVAGQDGKLKLEVDAGALRGKVESAIKSAAAGAKGEVKLDLDAGALRGKVESAIRSAGAGARVKVGMDLDEAGLRGRVAAAVAGAGGQRVRVGLDIDERGMARAQNAMRSFSRDAERTFGGGGGGGGGFFSRRSGVGSLSVGSLLTGLTMLEPALGALIAPFKSVGTAAAVLVPTFLGLTTMGIALAVGVQGVGTAMGEAGKDTVKYGEALNNLAPAAQGFVQASSGIGGAFSSMRLPVQQALFAGLGEEIQKLGGSALPIMSAGLVGMAGLMNTSFKQVSGTLNTLSNTGQLEAMFGGLQTAFEPLVSIPSQLVDMLTKVSIAASPLLTRITKGIASGMTDMTDKIAQSFESGRLQASIDQAGASIGKFFTNFKNNGAVQDFISNLKQHGPAAADNLQKIGEAGLTLLNSSSGVGAALLNIGGAMATMVNAMPTGLLSNIMLLAGGMKLVSMVGSGLGKANAAIRTLGTSIVGLGTGRNIATQATALRGLGAAGTVAATALGSGVLSAGAIQRQAAAMGTSAIAVRQMSSRLSTAGQSFITFGAGAAGAATGMGALKAGAIAVGATFFAMKGVDAVMDKVFGKPASVKQMAQGFQEFAATGKLTGVTAKTLGDNFSKFGESLNNVAHANPLEKIKNSLARGLAWTGLDAFKDKNKDLVNSVDDTLASLVRAGQGNVASKLFDNLAKAAVKSGTSVEKLKSTMDNYGKAQKEAAAVERIAAASMGTFGVEAIKTQKALAANNGEVQGLAGSYNALGRFNASAIGAQLQYNQAVSQAKDALGKNSNALSMNAGILNTTTPKAQQAAGALLNMAEAAKVSAEAFTAKGDPNMVLQTYKAARAQIEGMAKAQGLNAAQAREFTNQILPMPNIAKLVQANFAATAKSLGTVTAAMAKAPDMKKFTFDPGQLQAASTFRTAMEAVGAQVKTLDSGKIEVKVDTSAAKSAVQSLSTVFDGLSKGLKEVKIPAGDIGKVGDALKKAGFEVAKISDTKIKITAEDGTSMVIEGIKAKIKDLASTKFHNEAAWGNTDMINKYAGSVAGAANAAKEVAKNAQMSKGQLADYNKAWNNSAMIDKYAGSVGKAGDNTRTTAGDLKKLDDKLKASGSSLKEVNALLDQHGGVRPSMGLAGRGGGSLDQDMNKLKEFKDMFTQFKGAGAGGLQVGVMISGTEDIEKLKELNNVEAKNIQVAVNISGTEDIEKLKELNNVDNKMIQVAVNISGTEDIEKLKELNNVDNKIVQVAVNISGTEDIEKLKTLNDVNNKIVQVAVNISGTEDIEKLKALNEVNNKSVIVQVNISGTEDIEKLKALNEVNNKSVQVAVNISGTEQIDKLKALNEVNNKSVQVSVNISGTEQIDKLKALNEVNNKSVMVAVNISGTEQIDKLKALNEVNNKSIMVAVSVSGADQVDKLKALNEVNNKSITVSVAVSGADQVEKLKALNEVSNKSITVSVSVSGADQIEKLKGLNEVSAKNISVNVSITGADQIAKLKDLSSLPASKTVTITINANAGPVNQIKSALAGISNKTVTVTVSANAGPVNQIKSALASISNKSVTVSVSANAGPINQVKAAIASISNKSVTVSVSANAGPIQALKSAIDGVSSKSVTVTATASPGQVNALKAAISSVQGKSVTVTANVNGTGAVQGLVAAIAAVQSKTVTVTVNTVKTGSAATGGLMSSRSLAPGFASGGRSYKPGGKVFGPGSATSDDIFARLSNGEFVVRTAMVNKYGPEMLAAINNGSFNPMASHIWMNKAMKRWVPGFHRGGSTSSSSTYGVGGAEKDEAPRGNWGDQFATGINYTMANSPQGSNGGNVSLSSLYRGAHNSSVLLLQKALKEVFPQFDYSSGPGHFGPLTQKFYAMWQKQMGFKGSDANGIPGLQSLLALANKTGEFTLKSSQATLKYTVQLGDTLTSVAKKFSISVEELLKVNQNLNANSTLKKGVGINIPIPGTFKIPAVIPGTKPGDWNYLAPPNFSKLGRRKTKGTEDTPAKDVPEVESVLQLSGMSTFDANHFFGNLTGTNSASLVNKLVEATDLKSLTSVLDDMRTQVFKAFSNGTARDNLQSYLAQGGKIEIQYIKNLEEVNKSLEDAKKEQDKVKSSYESLRDSLQQAIHQFASISKIGKSGGSVETMIRQMTADSGTTKEFEMGLQSLKTRGLSQTALTEIAALGPQEGVRGIRSLLQATPEQIAKLNALQAQVDLTARNIGTSTSSALYQAGIEAADGLVAGLTAQKTAIEKAMKDIALAMATALKQALGIKSPSKVMHENGVWTMRGLIQGMHAEGKNLDEIVRACVEKIVGGTTGVTAPAASWSKETAGDAKGGWGRWNGREGDFHVNGGVHVHIDGSNVNFNNADERRAFCKDIAQDLMEEFRGINRKRK